MLKHILVFVFVFVPKAASLMDWSLFWQPAAITISIVCAASLNKVFSLLYVGVYVSRMNVRRHFFTERIGLPPSVVDFRSLSSFKRTANNARVNLFTRY